MREILKEIIDYVAAIAVVIGILIMIWFDFMLGIKIIVTGILVIPAVGILVE